MRISDWSSDVCSSDLRARISSVAMPSTSSASHRALTLMTSVYSLSPAFREASPFTALAIMASPLQLHPAHRRTGERLDTSSDHPRSEEHTSELQSLMRISYAVFCLQNKHINKPFINRQL